MDTLIRVKGGGSRDVKGIKKKSLYFVRYTKYLRENKDLMGADDGTGRLMRAEHNTV